MRKRAAHATRWAQKTSRINAFRCDVRACNYSVFAPHYKLSRLDTSKQHLRIPTALRLSSPRAAGELLGAVIRVNIEDDLWTSGRLSKLARSMKWSEHEALGALVNVYRLTQRARLVSDTADRIATVIVIGFDSDEAAQDFITAMISAQLASVKENGHVHIRGNGDRIAELDAWYEKSVRGGRARAASGNRDAMGQWKKPNELTSQSPATIQPVTSQAPGVLSPMSLVLGSKDLQTAFALAAPPKKKTKSTSVTKTPTDTHRIRLAFEAAYEAKYKTAYLNWDGAHGRFAKELGASGQSDRAIDLLPEYFALTLKEPHTFYEGFESFKAMLNKLNGKRAPPANITAQIAEQAERNRKQLEEFL